MQSNFAYIARKGCFGEPGDSKKKKAITKGEDGLVVPEYLLFVVN